ncbi:MAG: hypothetical protein EOL88_01940 [Bacteroidia bacterium]|nr:hypothetical protein [Bacteroidia bacterium]
MTTKDIRWIQRFSNYTKALLRIYGSKDATRMAFLLGIIENGDVWMDMIQSRNLTSHTYNQDTAAQIAAVVLDQYFHEFVKLRNTLTIISSKSMSDQCHTV